MLARLVWGDAVSVPPVDFAVVRRATGWSDATVFSVKAACLVAVTLLIGLFLAHPAASRHLPRTLAAATAVMVVLLGPLGGSSANPARQFGSALLSNDPSHLVVHRTAPLAGPVLGAVVHRLLRRDAMARPPLTYHLGSGREAAPQP